MNHTVQVAYPERRGPAWHRGNPRTIALPTPDVLLSRNKRRSGRTPFPIACRDAIRLARYVTHATARLRWPTLVRAAIYDLATSPTPAVYAAAQ